MRLLSVLVRTMTTRVSPTLPELESSSPTGDEITLSAEAATKELRAQVTLQIGDANSLDTKISALVTAEIAVAGLVASRIRLDTPMRLAIGLLGFAILVAVALPAAQALRPRARGSHSARTPRP